MQINIKDIEDGDLQVRFEDAAGNFPILSKMIQDGECDFLSPISTRARVRRVTDLVEIDGKVETTIRTACGRCLNEYITKLSNPYRLAFTKELPESLREPDQSEIELDAEEMGLILFKGDTIDLRESLQEQVVLALPQKPLCSTACKGLCSKCGRNLNEGDCGCNTESFGPMFDALKDFKVEDK